MDYGLKWHTAFCSGLEIEFREYQDVLEFHREYQLSKEPLRMDLLVIKKLKDIQIDNPIGKFFKKHNIVEYKSPEDELSIDDFYKTVGYAFLYKGLGKYVNEIPIEELTVSIFRHSYPRELFRFLESLDAVIEHPENGIYYVTDMVGIPVQIVVTKEFPNGIHSALKVLTRRADEYDARRFVAYINGFTQRGDRDNADSVLQVSISANRELYNQIMEDTDMCEALRELMKDQIDKELNEAREIAMREGRAEGRAEGHAEGVTESRVDSIRNLMTNLQLPPNKAMAALGIPKREYRKYTAML